MYGFVATQTGMDGFTVCVWCKGSACCWKESKRFDMGTLRISGKSRASHNAAGHQPTVEPSGSIRLSPNGFTDFGTLPEVALSSHRAGANWNFSAVPVLLTKSPFRICPKLEVGAVDDPLEREPDAVADRVMRMPDPSRAVLRDD